MKIYSAIDSDAVDVGAYADALACIRNMGVRVDLGHELQAKLRNGSKVAKERGWGWAVDNLYETYRKTLLYCAPECFDDYMLYMEIDRPYKKKFYLPRRKQLKPLAEAFEQMEFGELEMLGISLPPGVGKSTLAEFGLTWKGGRHPEQPMVVGSHSNSFLRGMYGELLRMLDKNGEYKWHDVFPTLQVINTNAQDMMIDLGEDARDGKRFMTIEMASAGSGMSGRIRAEGLLYCDDLVSSLEEALSRERMDKLYQTYSVDYRQRKIGKCPELHIATRWSVHDVIGRLEQMYGDDPKAKFIVCPALDENEESNFDYPIPAGFTTKYYLEMREAMDDASFRALFMGQPVEREGQLYPENELRRYYELPETQPDAVLAVTDTKDSGKDYCCMLIAFQYGMDFYIEDMVFENFSPEIIDEQLVMKLCKYNVQMCQFESNAAGGRTADRVQEKVKAAGGITKITKKWTQSNKETKIIVASPFVKEHFLFKDASKIKDHKEYRDFLRYLCGYTMAGKNAHDDAPDAVAQLAEYVQHFSAGKVEVMKSPFRR